MLDKIAKWVYDEGKGERMTSIATWKCDVCGKIFMDGDSCYNLCGGVHILLEGYGIYYPEEKIDFDDVCHSCMQKLSRAINDTIQAQ